MLLIAFLLQKEAGWKPLFHRPCVDVSCSVGGTEQCGWTLIMDILARCVRCFNYSIREFCFSNILIFHSTHAAGCSQSYHAKILAGAGNGSNLLLSFMSLGEHTISQFYALHYLPTNF